MLLLQQAQNKPDLILMDLMMPVMNGFDFLKSIRETELSSIPVLVLTGVDLSEDEKYFCLEKYRKFLKKVKILCHQL